MVEVEEIPMVDVLYIVFITMLKRAEKEKKRLAVEYGTNMNKVYYADDRILAMEEMPTPNCPKYTYYITKEAWKEYNRDKSQKKVLELARSKY